MSETEDKTLYEELVEIRRFLAREKYQLSSIDHFLPTDSVYFSEHYEYAASFRRKAEERLDAIIGRMFDNAAT